MEYVVEPLSFGNFRFDHSIPTVKMHKVHMRHVTASVPWLQQRQQGQPHHNLSEHCGRFMRNYHSGTSEDGLHSRDDELLMVRCFCSIFGLELFSGVET